MDFFEGTEKRIEIGFKLNPPDSLRDKGFSYWSEFVKSVKCEIITFSRAPYFDAFLLSESSLFVYNNTIILLTCGNTEPFNAIEFLLEECGPITSVTYSHMPFLRPGMQPESYQNYNTEANKLSILSNRLGHGFHQTRVGKLVSFTTDLQRKPTHTALYMYGLVLDESLALDCIRFYGEMDVSAYILHEHKFLPCGYSMNGVLENGTAYCTIHVTPQESCSYASFETNAATCSEKLVSSIISTFKPRGFTFISPHERLNLLISGYTEQKIDPIQGDGYYHHFDLDTTYDPL